MKITTSQRFHKRTLRTSLLALLTCNLLWSLSGCTTICHVHAAQDIPIDLSQLDSDERLRAEMRGEHWPWSDVTNANRGNRTTVEVGYDYTPPYDYDPLPFGANCSDVSRKEERLSDVISLATLPELSPSARKNCSPTRDDSNICDFGITGPNGGINFHNGQDISSSGWNQHGNFEAAKKEYYAQIERKYKVAATEINKILDSDSFHSHNAYNATITVGKDTTKATADAVNQVFSALAKKDEETAWPKVQVWIDTLVGQEDAARAEAEAAQAKKDEELAQSSDAEKSALVQQALHTGNWELAKRALDSMSPQRKEDPYWILSKARVDEGKGDLKSALDEYRAFNQRRPGREIEQKITDLLYHIQAQ